MTFVSASITAIFSTKIDRDPKKAGSYGVGFTVDMGVEARASEREGVFLNGERVSFPTVEHVLERLGGTGVDLRTRLPVSCGFGVSGASALATAVEISLQKGLNLPFFRLADIAHEAEVVNRTGLGDVVTQSFGGIVARVRPGSPSKSRVERFLSRAEVDFLVLGQMSTKEVLGDEVKRRSINQAGKKRLKEFLKKPSLENLFVQAKKFSLESGLADDEIVDVIEAVESRGGLASMVMLGRSVFALNGKGAFEEFGGDSFSARITGCSVRL
ncbi:MAG: GHMP kinase [Archaeoglobi archaeon]|nr:GHMP kinase [Archaeoglobi archaeon]